MISTLFSFTLDNWQAALFSFIPALVNLCIFIYVYFLVPKTKTTTTFSLFVLSLFVWQMHETMMRLSLTAQTAILWNQLLNVGSSFIVPFGLHFALIFTRREKLANSSLLLFLYLPYVFLSLIVSSGINQPGLVHHPFWSWQMDSDISFINQFRSLWISATAFVILLLLFSYAWQCRKQPNVTLKQSTLIAIGFAIPTVQGTATQVIIPIFTQLDSIPVASTFMTCFSICTIIAIRKYEMFRFSPIEIPQTIFNNMAEGISIVNNNYMVQYINDKFCQITGYSPEELLEKPTYQLLPYSKEDKELMRSMIGSISSTYELKMRHKSGKMIWVKISRSPIKDNKGHIVGSTGIIMDITLRKEAVLKLHEKQEELNLFIYKSSHDLRSPLSSIEGLIQLARKEIRDKTTLSYFEKIEACNKRMKSVLLDLSQVIKITKGETVTSTINVNNEIDEILQSISYLENFGEIDIQSKINSHLTLNTDRSLFNSIIQNILVNAIKYQRYNATRSYIKIEAKIFNGFTKIAVSDNGQGISEESCPRVFEMFYRGNIHSQGTGLGLYIVKNAVEKLGGHITLTSELDKGSTFTVFLPISIEQ
ncbi:MAG: hypothetical protein COA57_14285 [Flavobacteriales bacterium]|nr:MAG: hypothetical protein COA57_14285 [Flavobacteriales bacterium]